MEHTYYTTYDLPIPYKNLLLYPITIKDYLLFTAYSSCLNIDKNSIPDAKIISMTYLEYLYHATLMTPEETPYVYSLDRILAMSLKEDSSFLKIEESISRYKQDEQNKPYFTIGKEKFYSKEFEEIRRIICEQNMVELPDENVSKEVRDSLEEARQYKMRMNGSKPATLEDYIVSLATATGWTFDYIHSLTIRKFFNAVKRLDNLIHYKIFLASSMSGFVEFKDKSFIKHWLTNLDEDKYDDVSIDLDAMEKKISV